MGSQHQHAFAKGGNKERALYIALGLTTSFFIIELLGGFITQSLALLSDAAHTLTDVTALVFALVAIRIGSRPTDQVRTFGYHRLEILSAAFNTLLLFCVAVYILIEAYHRLQQPPEIRLNGMMAVAAIGILVNLVAMGLLTSTKDQHLGIKSAYIEVFSDMLGSIGVLIGAVIIRLTGIKWIDSVIAMLIAVWVLPRGWILLKESLNVLLEGVPKGIDLKQLEQAILNIDGVSDVHELHVWAIATGKVCLTAHVVIEQKYDCDYITPLIRQMLTTQYGIWHTTLQHERTKCMQGHETCHFSNHDEDKYG